MKANSLEELVTNSNIAGELRNYTDWHTRLVKFAQLVADWQKEQVMKNAVEGMIYQPAEHYWAQIIAQYDGELKHGDKVRIVVLKEEEE